MSTDELMAAWAITQDPKLGGLVIVLILGGITFVGIKELVNKRKKK